MFFLFVLFATWTIIIGIYIISVYKQAASGIIAYFACTFGYACFFIFLLGSLKMTTIKD